MDILFSRLVCHYFPELLVCIRIIVVEQQFVVLLGPAHRHCPRVQGAKLLVTLCDSAVNVSLGHVFQRVIVSELPVYVVHELLVVDVLVVFLTLGGFSVRVITTLVSIC